jgi:integrase/recombinase XerD
MVQKPNYHVDTIKTLMAILSRKSNKGASMSNQSLMVVQYNGLDVEIPVSTPSDEQLMVASWLASKRSKHTRLMYRINAEQFFQWIMSDEREKPRYSLTQVQLPDLQAYAFALEKKYPDQENTQAQKLATIKSLFTFGVKLGVLPLNPGALLQLPKGKDKLAERILTPSQVYAMIEASRRLGNPRDHAIIMLLYASAIRCEEICNLQWIDVKETERENGGQITVFGKRRHTRTISLHPTAWNLLQSLKPEHVQPKEYVFASRQSHKLSDGTISHRMDEASVWRVVKKVAKESGIPNASTHWLRHSHATHTMRKKVPLAIIMETMGHTDFRAAKRYQHVDPEESSSLHLDL